MRLFWYRQWWEPGRSWPAERGGWSCPHPGRPAGECGPAQRYARSHSAPPLKAQHTEHTGKFSEKAKQLCNLLLTMRRCSRVYQPKVHNRHVCTKSCMIKILEKKYFQAYELDWITVKFHLCKAKWNRAASSFCCHLSTLPYVLLIFLYFKGRRRWRMRCLVITCNKSTIFHHVNKTEKNTLSKQIRWNISCC